MWIGATQLLEGLPMEYCFCGIRGLWRRSKSVWRILLLPAPLDVEDSFSCALARVYGSNFDCNRRYLWEELDGLLSW
jgi:hypothetical protein